MRELWPLVGQILGGLLCHSKEAIYRETRAILPLASIAHTSSGKARMVFRSLFF